MNFDSYIILVLVSFLSGLLSWIFTSNKYTGKLNKKIIEKSKLEVSQEDSNNKLEEYKDEVKDLKLQVEEINNRLIESNSSLRERDTTVTERERNLKELKEQFETQKNSLKDEFQVLSNNILKENQESLSVKNQEGISSLIEPLKEKIISFQQRVNEVHNEQTAGRSKLESQITNLVTLNNNLKDEAGNLAKALKNNKKTLGNWGELQVEKLLEGAGLVKGREYKREDSFRNAEHEIRRPDFVIYLPENKHIIIDSKVSLNDYVLSVNAGSDEEREIALKSHVQCVSNHIESLAGKNYSNLDGLNSPDFIFMFMPMETAYLAAFEASPDLFSKAYENKIAVVTPNTLLPILRTVASLWNIDKQNLSTKQLALAAEKIYDKLRVFSEKFIKVESQIETVRKSYQDAHNTLSGSRSLINMAEGFKDLGIKVNKSLPATLIEESDSSLDLIDEGIKGSIERAGK